MAIVPRNTSAHTACKASKFLKSLQAKLFKFYQEGCETRVEIAVLTMKNSNGTFFMTKTAKAYNVSKTTLFHCLKGCQNQAQYYTSKQFLILEKETALKHLILQL